MTVVHKKIVLIIYRFMVMERCISWYEEYLQKKQGAASHFRVKGDQTHLYNLSTKKLLSKAYVRTARMPFAKVGNFMTWSDFTILSIVKLVVLTRENIVLIMPKRLIINSLIQI